MNRRTFLQDASLLATSSFISLPAAYTAPPYPVVRPAPSQRRFRSWAVEATSAEFGRGVKASELAWLFGSCFPNTLDPTVTPGTHAGRPDSYVSAGDIDAMWLRDSATQVWPYLALVKQDAPLRQLVASVVHRHTRYIQTAKATDTQPLGGYGYPVRPCGLIASAFRPSDDATLLPFLVPGNFFAVASLRQAALMLNDIHHDDKAYANLRALAEEVSVALRQHAIVAHPTHGPVYAYEVDGYGGHMLLDDANVPSLLALPYLGAVPLTDPIYQNTRRLVSSTDNAFFYKSKAAEGIGGPHVGAHMI